MKKIQVWANFCPKKFYWELRRLPTFKAGSEEWWENPALFKEQLRLLKKAGITGLRLNIFNTELTTDALTIHWKPLDLFLQWADETELEIHLCLGPYQYPLWPGIRLPSVLLKEKKIAKVIDQNKKFKEFGLGFLEEQLKRYAKHKLITGFYLGNEWHTTQRIEDFDKKNEIFTISVKHMESMARLCKKLTKKPILLNTNFQANQLKQLEHTFLSLIKILRNQAWIGFDIYPSQENLIKSPFLLLHRKLHTYQDDIGSLKKKFIPRLLISEFEAQPWGNGESWYDQIKKSPDVVKTSAVQLDQTFPTFVSSKQFEQATLWGAEFWLIAYHMGHSEMLDQVLSISS